MLFRSVLSDTLPERVVVVDAVTQSDREPGEIFEIDVDQMDPKKIPDFTLHQFPTTPKTGDASRTLRKAFHAKCRRSEASTDIILNGK